MPRLILLAGVLFCGGLLLTVTVSLRAVPISIQQSAPATLAFEVASIKPAPPGVNPPAVAGPDRPAASRAVGGGPCSGNPQIDHNRVVISNVTTYTLVAWAFGKNCQLAVKSDLISGSPSWMRSEMFELQAQMPDGSPTYTAQQLRNGSAPALQAMIETLLADRLRLKVVSETKEASVYVLTVAKNGTKLKPAGADSRNRLAIEPNGDEILDSTASIDGFGTQLGSQFLGRPVVNKTGIPGLFNFHLEFHSEEDAALAASLGARVPSTGPAFPSIFTALEEQLGLKLESTKGPVEVLRIDHIERPESPWRERGLAGEPGKLRAVRLMLNDAG